MKKSEKKIKKIINKKKKVIKKVVHVKAKAKAKAKASAKTKTKKVVLKRKVLKPAKKAAPKKPILVKTKPSFGPVDVKPYQSKEEEFNLELRARDRERKLLRKIEETLSRINDQDYGYCDDCGAEIGVRRLEARPTANQCIECKTISEIREKQIGDGN